jgi:hypothetical protein
MNTNIIGHLIILKICSVNKGCREQSLDVKLQELESITVLGMFELPGF